MNESKRLPLYNLYLDDSGTRHPDRRFVTSPKGDWFALGGILIKEEAESEARKLHADFCGRWSIDYPLHSVKIRHKSDEFAWLKTIPKSDADAFYQDLQALIVSVPVLGHACVIDRPGYHGRYFEMYGRRRWHLCKTAFSIVCERVAKLAVRDNRRVRVFVEETDRDADRRISGYFKELRAEGLPFGKDTSSKYGPLDAVDLRYRLLDQGFKRKSSPMMQLADLYLYPMCRGRYDAGYGPTLILRDHAKLVDCIIEQGDIEHLGIKYSCFDEQNKKGP